MKTVFECPQCNQIAFMTSSNTDMFKVCPVCGEMMKVLDYKYEQAEKEWLERIKGARDYQ